MKYMCIIVIISLFSCKRNDKSNFSSQVVEEVLNKQGSISVIYEENGTANVDLRNWQGSLPDSIYEKRVINLAIMDNSNVKIREGFLNKLSYFTISKSRLGSDTLYLDRSFKSLNHLCLINPRCVIMNLDSITIRKLDYFSRENLKYNLTLDFNKIKGLDTMTIDAPTEYIEIPTNKNYKRITICTKNNQIEKLKKYYDNVILWISCK